MRTKANHSVIVATLYLSSLAFAIAGQSDKLAPSPGVGISRRMTTKWIDRKVLENYRQGDFEVMALENPLLAGAYLHIAAHMGSHVFRENPPRDDFEWAAYENLKKRGNETTPLLLRLCSENQYSNAEGQIISMVGNTPEITPEPFLEYIRKAIKDRGQMLGPNIWSYFCYFLARFGTSSDAELLKKWGKDRPYLAQGIDQLIRRAAIDRGDAIIPELSPAKHPEVNQAVKPDSFSTAESPESTSDQSWFPGRRLSKWFFWVSIGLAVFFVGKCAWGITHKKSP